MSRQRLGKLQCLSVLEVMLLAILLLGCSGKELEPDVSSGNKNTAEACFIFDPKKLPPILRGKADLNVTWLPDSPKSFPPVPDLEFGGIKFSSIDFRKDTENPPEVFAFNEFKISKKDGQDKATYLKKCIKLYESTWLGLRSSNDLRKNQRPVRELETVISFLNFQIRRLGGDVPDVEAALDNAIKKCFQCGVKERYNLIALASQSGVDPDWFLKTLPELKCKSRRECLDLLNNKENKSTQLDGQPNNQNSFVTLNPAKNNSSRNKSTILSILFITGCTISISYL